MKNEEKLYLALGEIDDSLIEEATTPIKRSGKVIKIVAIAASGYILTTAALASAGIGLLLNGGMVGNKDSAPSFDDIYNDGSSRPNYGGSSSNGSPAPNEPENSPGDSATDGRYFYSDFGLITLKAKVDNQIFLTLEIFRESDSLIHVSSYNKYGMIISSTDPEASVDLMPIILVNGRQSDSLPSEVGVYSVSIIFPDESDDNDVPSNPEIDNPSEDGDVPSTPEIDDPKDETHPSSGTAYFIIDGFGILPFDEVD